MLFTAQIDWTNGALAILYSSHIFDVLDESVPEDVFLSIYCIKSVSQFIGILCPFTCHYVGWLEYKTYLPIRAKMRITRGRRRGMIYYAEIQLGNGREVYEARSYKNRPADCNK